MQWKVRYNCKRSVFGRNGFIIIQAQTRLWKIFFILKREKKALPRVFFFFFSVLLQGPSKGIGNGNEKKGVDRERELGGGGESQQLGQRFAECPPAFGTMQQPPDRFPRSQKQGLPIETSKVRYFFPSRGLAGRVRFVKNCTASSVRSRRKGSRSKGSRVLHLDHRFADTWTWATHGWSWGRGGLGKVGSILGSMEKKERVK